MRTFILTLELGMLNESLYQNGKSLGRTLRRSTVIARTWSHTDTDRTISLPEPLEWSTIFTVMNENYSYVVKPL